MQSSFTSDLALILLSYFQGRPGLEKAESQSHRFHAGILTCTRVFSLRISLVNMIKSDDSCEYGHIY